MKSGKPLEISISKTLIAAFAAMMLCAHCLMADTITVSSAPPSQISAAVGQLIEVNYTFSAPDFLSSISGSIDWGDGSWSTPINWNGEGYNSASFGAAHEYLVPGDYTLSLTAEGSSYATYYEIIGYQDVPTGEYWHATLGGGYWTYTYAEEPVFGFVSADDANSSLGSKSNVTISEVAAAPLPSSCMAGLSLLAFCGVFNSADARDAETRELATVNSELRIQIVIRNSPFTVPPSRGAGGTPVSHWKKLPGTLDWPKWKSGVGLGRIKSKIT